MPHPGRKTSTIKQNPYYGPAQWAHRTLIAVDGSIHARCYTSGAERLGPEGDWKLGLGEAECVIGASEEENFGERDRKVDFDS